MLIIELKKLVLLRQYKLHMKPTISLYSEIQQCQMNFVFCVFYCNLKEKGHIRRIINNNKRTIYMRN